MHGRVALVTDSTACIPPELAAQWGIGIVPIQIQIGQWIGTEDRVPPAGAHRRAVRVLRTAAPDPAGGRIGAITLTEVSSAIGVHVGPGAVGISISPA